VVDRLGDRRDVARAVNRQDAVPLMSVVLAAGLVFAVAVAVAAADWSGRPPQTPTAGTWSWDDHNHGRVVVPSELTRSVAHSGGIDVGTLREVVAVTTTSGERFAVVAAASDAGEPCFSFGAAFFAGSLSSTVEN
jgi:hypothetical protein